MENLSTITCGTFLEELASKAPTPGGGAASALCGAVAAALTAMLANLTVGKAGSEENEQQTAQIIAAAGKLREELTALADDDAAVFGKFMAAYKMPKTTDEEKAARTAAIQQAAVAAADVPMQIAEKSMEGLLKTPLMLSRLRPKCRCWRPKHWKQKLLCWRARMKF